jgi:hypothetical protein
MAEDEVTMKLFGIPVTAKGVNGIAMGIMACALAACMFLLYDRTKQSEVHLDEISQAHAIARDRQTAKMAQEHTAIVEALQGLKDVNLAVGDSLNEQNFIILSNEAQRQAIKEKIRMPDSLKKKLDR